MNSVGLGNRTSGPEVTNVSRHGLWLLLDCEALFLTFATFPWFQGGPIGKVLHVEQPSARHLYWPELDIDLAVECIRRPERFPLFSRIAC